MPEQPEVQLVAVVAVTARWSPPAPPRAARPRRRPVPTPVAGRRLPVIVTPVRTVLRSDGRDAADARREGPRGRPERPRGRRDRALAGGVRALRRAGSRPADRRRPRPVRRRGLVDLADRGLDPGAATGLRRSRRRRGRAPGRRRRRLDAVLRAPMVGRTAVAAGWLAGRDGTSTASRRLRRALLSPVDGRRHGARRRRSRLGAGDQPGRWWRWPGAAAARISSAAGMYTEGTRADRRRRRTGRAGAARRGAVPVLAGRAEPDVHRLDLLPGHAELHGARPSSAGRRVDRGGDGLVRRAAGGQQPVPRSVPGPPGGAAQPARRRGRPPRREADRAAEEPLPQSWPPRRPIWR